MGVEGATVAVEDKIVEVKTGPPGLGKHLYIRSRRHTNCSCLGAVSSGGATVRPARQDATGYPNNLWGCRAAKPRAGEIGDALRHA